jgi:nucleosome binding factor SPN SPT16 subunit
LIIKSIKVDIQVCDVYNAAINFIKEKDEKLVDYFVKRIGFGIGYDYNDQYLSIDSNNKVLIKNDMTFVLVVGFDNLELKDKKYSLVISDTILISNSKVSSLTQSLRAYNDISYAIDEEEEVEILDKNNILDERTRKRVETEEEKRKKIQQELLLEKRETKKKTKTITNDKFSLEEKLAKGELISYETPFKYPKISHNTIFVDEKNESVLLPINGTHIPFHISTIKNVSKSEENEYTIFRINFKNSQINFGQLYAPAKEFPNSVFIKELSFRSKDARNLTNSHRLLQVMKKKSLQEERDINEQKGLVEQDALKLTKGKSIPKLRDILVRPALTGKKTIGVLEIHENGLRFQSNKGQSIDILYSNIKQSFFQEAKHDTIVLLHFHLHQHIMVGKKKQKDIQFYAEVVEAIDQLVIYHLK